jgi:fatty-acyl-CoA synthase
MGRTVSRKGEVQAEAVFAKNERLTVIGEDGKELAAGSNDVGLVAVGGALPMGYYKDPAATAKTFRVVDGRRYVVAGDLAMVRADGSIRLLGRGSECINTGGEKVFPEEVDQVLKSHAQVRDSLTVGLADQRWGQRVVSAVVLRDGADVSTELLRAYCRERMAAYKVPKRIVVLDDLGRSAAGKPNYPQLRAILSAVDLSASTAADVR